MDNVKLGKTGLAVSPVGFGVLTVGPWQMNLPVKEGAAVLRYALEAGINFMDTAQYYKTYPVIREALKGFGKADDLVIASKSLDASYREMEKAIEEARIETDRDVLEIFMLHEVRGEDDFRQRAGAWECLQTCKAKGIVKSIGISTHHVDVAELAPGLPEADVLFPLINFQSLGIRHGAGPGSKEDMAKAIEAAGKAGKGVFAMKVFGGGNLTRHYQEAIHYVRDLPGVDSLMIGFGHTDEIDRAIEIMEGRLESAYAPDIKHKKVRIDQGDCMSCHACVKRCPNHAIYITAQGTADINHDRCLTCGYCAPVCDFMAIIMF